MVKLSIHCNLQFLLEIGRYWKIKILCYQNNNYCIHGFGFRLFLIWDSIHIVIMACKIEISFLPCLKYINLNLSTSNFLYLRGISCHSAQCDGRLWTRWATQVLADEIPSQHELPQIHICFNTKTMKHVHNILSGNVPWSSLSIWTPA